jgi:hypothetical protein
MVRRSTDRILFKFGLVGSIHGVSIDAFLDGRRFWRPGRVEVGGCSEVKDQVLDKVVAVVVAETLNFG